MTYPFVLHQFRPSETIDAVMRLKGRHNYTHDELKILRGYFNELNGLDVPRAGQTFKIPLFGIPVDVPVEASPVIDGKEPAHHQETPAEGHPVDKLPGNQEPQDTPYNGTKENGDQQMTPDAGETVSQKVDVPVHGLAVSGSRRRPAPR